MLGGDVQFGNLLLGGFLGYRDIDVAFADAIVGSEAEASGWQLGLTAAYDVGSFYIRGLGSRAKLDGDLERRFDIGTLAGESRADPALTVWSFYGELVAASTWAAHRGSLRLRPSTTPA